MQTISNNLNQLYTRKYPPAHFLSFYGNPPPPPRVPPQIRPILVAHLNYLPSGDQTSPEEGLNFEGLTPPLPKPNNFFQNDRRHVAIIWRCTCPPYPQSQLTIITLLAPDTSNEIALRPVSPSVSACPIFVHSLRLPSSGTGAHHSAFYGDTPLHSNFSFLQLGVLSAAFEMIPNS